nr:hypothetical protein [Tanacetum cinerariifolium]
MVSYLEKSDDNTKCHQILDFLSSCSITYALTAVVVSESLVRSTLFFDDEDGVTCLTNDEIFENLALMGYEPLSTKFNFQKGNVTPLFNNMLVQNQAPEGEGNRYGGSPRHQETIGGTSAQTRYKRMVEQPNEPLLSKSHTSKSREGRLEENIELTDIVPTTHDSPLTRGYTPGSDEGSITLAELMETCITLSNRLSLDEELAQKLYAKDLAKDEARQEQERYNLEKDLELQRQLDQRKENVPKGDQAKEIDWNDPQVLRYHALQNRPFSKAKPLFEKTWDQVYTFVPKDFEIEKEVIKRVGFDLQQGGSKKQRLDQQTEETEEETKAQGNSDQEVEELKLYMRIIPKEDIEIKAIPLAIKPPVIIEYKIIKEGKTALITLQELIEAQKDTHQ